MCDQPQIDEISDISETECEGWDIIKAEELSAENTSDAESIEVINEEETVQTCTEEQNSSDNAEICLIQNEKENTAVSSTHCTEIRDTSEATSCSATSWFHEYIPTSININSLLSEQKNAFIYFAVVCLFVAMFIGSRDEQAKSTTAKTDVYECQGLTATLVKELQMYRESNAKLERQVKELYEVINGLNEFRFIAPVDQKRTAYDENNAKLKIEADSAHHSNKLVDELNEIIHFYKGLTNFPNTTNSLNNTFIFSDERFRNSPVINEIFPLLYNESIESTLKLFNKIPTHLNKLTEVISNKNTKPFIDKWGKKFQRFSKSIEEDLNKMKLKTIKHVLRGINDLTLSFYRRLCNSELHTFISFEECYSIYLSRPRNRRFHKSNGKSKKSNLNNEKLSTVDESDEMTVENEEEFHNDNLSEEKLFRRNYNEKIIEKQFKNIRDKKKNTNLEGKERNKIDRHKIMNGMNYSENLREENNVGAKPCGNNHNFVKCNHTSRREKLNSIDGNWYLNIGDQRSYIRREKKKFEHVRHQKRKFKNYERYHKPPPPAPPPSFHKKMFHKFAQNFGNLFAPYLFY